MEVPYEVQRILENAGFHLVRTAKSSGRFYSNGQRTVNVHYHGNKEVKTGTVNQILKDAGLK